MTKKKRVGGEGSQGQQQQRQQQQQAKEEVEEEVTASWPFFELLDVLGAA